MIVKRINYEEYVIVSYFNGDGWCDIGLSYHDWGVDDEINKMSLVLQEYSYNYTIIKDIELICKFALQLEALLDSGKTLRDLVGVEYTPEEPL